MAKGGETDEWPMDIQKAFVALTLYAHARDFSVLCAVGLNHEEKRLSVFFSPTTSQNPHLAEMCDDLAEVFTLMARRLRQ
jgi:hypothetical protein